jgi:hypothetical protein
MLGNGHWVGSPYFAQGLPCSSPEMILAFQEDLVGSLVFFGGAAGICDRSDQLSA